MEQKILFGIIVLLSIILIGGCVKETEGPKRENCIMGCLPTFEKEVVWAEPVPRNYTENIYLLYIATGMKSIVNSRPTRIMSLSKYEDKVVWIGNKKDDFWDPDWVMYIKDLSTGKETELTPIPAYAPSNLHSRLRFYKDKIVFIIQQGNRFPMYMYDLNTGIKTQLIASLVPETGYAIISSPCLDIYENKIVFKDHTGTPAIYLLDLDTKTKTKIAEGYVKGRTVGENCPSIYENKVVYGVWSEDLSTIKILLYNIDTKSTIEIAKLKKPLIMGELRGKLNLKIHEDKVRYTRSVYSMALDMPRTSSNCVLVDINTKKKTDITCEGGIKTSPAKVEST